MTTAQSPLSSRTLDVGLAGPADPFWVEAIKHQGKAAYNQNTSYPVFRNVKDFGAKGDGVTDDSVAINAAISFGNRCGGGGSCNSSTVTPALVYVPNGTYLVKKSIIAYYYTQLIGDAKNPPTLLADSSFTDLAVIDADPYIPGGAQWYQNQNNFFRSVRNFIIDVRRVPPPNANRTSVGTGIHWQVAQATSLFNIVFQMSPDPAYAQQGIWMENGSGGFMNDLVFNGGKFGMWVGNQQFTVRNIVINNAQTAIQGVWSWGWTFQNVTINNCQIGFDLLGGVGAEAIIDATVSNTPIFVRSASPSNGTLVGSVVLNNIQLNNVTTAVGVADGSVVLPGGLGNVAIDSWVQGNVYKGTNSTGVFTKDVIPTPPKYRALLNDAGQIFGRTHPQYENYHVGQFVSVRDEGATGDGETDDTAAINAALSKYAGCKIIFFDAGTYIVTSTITIPAGSRIVGEAWSVISGKGAAFQDQNNPQVVVRVGEPGSEGIVEITDLIFSTVGPAAGAIVVEWNIKETTQGSAGTWDTHIRLGGAAGTNLEIEQCLPGTDTAGCMAAFMALHLTCDSTAYLEGMWVWLADHTLDEDGISQLTIFSGRGILSESKGPVWMIGTASEHHTLYQYRLLNAENHYMGLIQTETPYFQPLSPPLPYPFSINSDLGDPEFPPGINMAWGLIVQSSSNILIFGAGLYSFYSNYSQDCIATRNCQTHIVNISDSSVHIYSLATVASTFQITVDGEGVVNQKDNNNGFASTVTVWSPA